MGRRWIVAITLVCAAVVLLSLTFIPVSRGFSGELTTSNNESASPCTTNPGRQWYACVPFDVPGDAQVSVSWHDTSGSTVDFWVYYTLDSYWYFSNGSSGSGAFRFYGDGGTEVIVICDMSSGEGNQTVAYSVTIDAPLL